MSNTLISVPDKKEKLPLSVTHPELAKEAYEWDPTKFTYGSDRKVNWVCSEAHTWEATIGHRALRGDGCPYCSGKKVLVGFNDLKSLFPEIANSAVGWDPSSITSGSSKKKTWICDNGHTWEASVAGRVRGYGCPVCAGQKVLAGANDLATINPVLAKEADGWDPKTVTSTSGLKRRWKCKLGHSWEASIRHRTYGTGCPICAGKAVLVGFNDFKTTHPHIAKFASGWDPTTLTARSGQLRKFECSEGHTTNARVDHRAQGIGCPGCAEYGYNPDKPAYLYFLEREDINFLQIGITNVPKVRMAKHKKNHWKIIEISGPMNGATAKKWESRILRMLKDKGADLSNEKIAGKFDGYSEAWSKSIFEVNSIKELMQLTEEFEESNDSASGK